MAITTKAFPWFRGSLRDNLILLVLVALVPMLVWATGLTVWNARQHHQLLEVRLAEGAGNITLAVEQEVLRTGEALEVIGLSQRLAVRDYASVHRQLSQMVQRHPSWNNVVLTDTNGQPVIDTALPYGPPLAGLGPKQAVYERAVRTGRMQVSNLLVDNVTGEAVVTLATPLRGVDGESTGVLLANLLPGKLSTLISSAGEGDDWVAAVNGGDGVILARSSMPERAVGQRVPHWVLAASEGRNEGIASGASIIGIPVTVAFKRSALTGWVVVYGAPSDLFVEDLRRNFVMTAGFGLLVLGLSILAASRLANRMLHPVIALSRMAAPFAAKKDRAEPTYPIIELDELHRALDGLSEALAESETRFRRLFASAPVMMDALDSDGRVIEVNECWLRTLGLARETVIGRRASDFHTLASRSYMESVIQPELLRTGTVDDLPVKLVTGEGDVRDVMIAARVQRDVDGSVTRIIRALRDVTEQRRIEAALARAIEEAEKANDAKTRFLAAASHDLRQPLQALSLYVGVLNDRLGGEQQSVMKAVGQCMDSLTGLLGDMLDVARLDAGTITPKPTDVVLDELIERVAASWRIQAQAKGLELKVVQCRAVVRTDFALMERVLSNLVANAVRYTERGRILIGCRRVGQGAIRLEVWDTGIGIPADQVPEIFEEFRQLGNPERRRDKGTGLGLAIVQRIAGLLGHEVSVRSVPGKGSVFGMTLPLSASTVAPAAPSTAAISASGGGRILVIEDEVHVRNALELVLSELGYEVAVGETVEQALDRMGGAAPDLAIVDFRLGGGVTGIDAIRRVRSRWGAGIKAVILTGDTDPAIIRQITAEGMHLLHKPLQVEALRGFLREVA